METQFIIAGPIEDEEQLWWSNEYGWVPGIGQATTLPKEILTDPLPIEATGIMEITMKMEYVTFYIPLPGGGYNKKIMTSEIRC